MNLMGGAKGWKKLYEYATSGQEMYLTLLGIYCLMVSLELYLKSLLVLRDRAYASPAELRFICHDYKKLIKLLRLLGEHNIADEVWATLQDYNLDTININDLKYPSSPRMWQIDINYQRELTHSPNLSKL